MRIRRLLAAAGAAGTAIAAAGLFGPPTPTASAAAGDIGPGSMMVINGAQCTANFVFEDADAEATYLGYAAHCAGTGALIDTNGCLAGTLPLGTPVQIEGAEFAGALAYSSWATMQAGFERDINKMVDYMQANSDVDADIVLGGVFDPGQLPLDLDTVDLDIVDLDVLGLDGIL